MKIRCFLGFALLAFPALGMKADPQACRLMLEQISGLEAEHLAAVDAVHPRASNVLVNFYEISKIFRATNFEKEVIEFLINDAKRLGFAYEVDAAGNLLIRVPSNQSHPKLQPWVALQAHVDMVANVAGLDSRKGFEDYLRNNGGVLPFEYKNGAVQSLNNKNTIGNDNGSGVALMMEYLRNPDMPRPNLELLFTVVEEDGLIGAAKLALPLKAKHIISLDSGQQDVGLIGSNGATRRNLSKKSLLRAAIPAEQKIYTIHFDGFLGGHSGLEIEKGRVNAIREMAFLLMELKIQFPELNFVSLRAGAEGIYNAIPKSYSVDIALSPERVKHLEASLRFYLTFRSREYRVIEKPEQFKLELLESESAAETYVAWSEVLPLLKIVKEMANGDLSHRLAPGIPGYPRLSSNLAFLLVDAGGIRGGMMPRFFSVESLQAFDDYNAQIFSQHMPDLEMDTFGYSPPWPPSGIEGMAGRIQDTARQLGLEKFHLEIAKGSVEGSELVKHYPDAEVIVIGVEVPSAHEPTETLPLESLALITRLLDTTLQQFIVR